MTFFSSKTFWSNKQIFVVKCPQWYWLHAIYIASYSIGLGLLNTCSTSFFRFEVTRRYLSSSVQSNIGFKYYLLWPGLIYSSFSIQCSFYIPLIGALHIDRKYWFQINTYLSDNAGPHKLWQTSVAQWVLAKTNITYTPQDLKKKVLDIEIKT